jgi:hypothetical protein
MNHQYRKKPVIIEARQLERHNAGDSWQKVLDWVNHEGGKARKVDPGQKPLAAVLVIETLEGDMVALEEDWVIKGVKGEFYPCKPDVFEATYEKVDDAPNVVVADTIGTVNM